MCLVTRARLAERVHVPSVGASSLPPTPAELCGNLEPAACQRHVLPGVYKRSACSLLNLYATLS